MAYPYDDLEEALGRPLTAEEQAQASAAVAPQTPSPGAGWVNVNGGWVPPDHPLAQNPGELSPVPKVWKDPVGGTSPAPGVSPNVAPTLPGVAAPTATTPTIQPLPAFTPTSGVTFAQPTVAPVPQYQIQDYTPLTAEELYDDPSYQFRFDQGQKALQTSQAAKGVTRTGGSMVNLVDYGQNAASQEFAAADARNRDDYNLALEVADRRYSPNLVQWQTQTDADQRAAELQFDRDWQREVYGRDDARAEAARADENTWKATDDDYRKQVFMADDNFRKAVYGTDDAFRKAVQAEEMAWKREVMEEERRRFLAELGVQ